MIDKLIDPAHYTEIIRFALFIDDHLYNSLHALADPLRVIAAKRNSLSAHTVQNIIAEPFIIYRDEI